MGTLGSPMLGHQRLGSNSLWRVRNKYSMSIISLKTSGVALSTSGGSTRADVDNIGDSQGTYTPTVLLRLRRVPCVANSWRQAQEPFTKASVSGIRGVLLMNTDRERRHLRSQSITCAHSF